MNEQEAAELIGTLTPEEKRNLLFFLNALKRNRQKTREELIAELTEMYDTASPEEKDMIWSVSKFVHSIHNG